MSPLGSHLSHSSHDKAAAPLPMTYLNWSFLILQPTCSLLPLCPLHGCPACSLTACFSWLCLPSTVLGMLLFLSWVILRGTAGDRHGEGQGLVCMRQPWKQMCSREPLPCPLGHNLCLFWPLVFPCNIGK